MRLAAPLLALLLCLPCSAAHAVSPWMVFFEKGSARLQADGSAVLDHVVTTVRVLKIPRLIVSGHSDRAGSLQSNLILSRRRAEAVRDELVRRGLADIAIDLEHHGEDQLLVETPDGVAERQNRRVAIIIHCIPSAGPRFDYMAC